MSSGFSIYELKIQVDPRNLLVESSKDDNTSRTPGSALVGTSVQVTIKGYGFTPGMSVTFESGNGPKPAASNVQLVSDTVGLDTITATVTVPYKKQLGRDPVWDLRVGSGGVLRDAFRVVR